MTSSRLPFLPYGRQDIDETDIAAVVATLKSDWLTGGPAVGAFERALTEAVRAPEAVACANGTAALHLAALAANIGPGDTIIVPALTFVATANAARYVGAEVVFCDVDPGSGLATVETVAAALSKTEPRAKALFVVHLNGQSADMDAIGALARAQGLFVVEDACHAIGGTSRTKAGGETMIGSCAHGDLTVFSFHPVKTITSAEGGAITAHDPAMAARLRRLRSHGITRDPTSFSQTQQAFSPAGTANPWYYEMAELGFNYRLSDLQCALGLSQLKRLSRFIDRRSALAARYDELLAPLSPLVRPISRNGCGTPAWHLYPVLIDFEALNLSRAELMSALNREEIGTQVHYLPVNRQPYYRDRYGPSALPGADAYYSKCLSLPLYPAMDDADASRVVDALARSLSA